MKIKKKPTKKKCQIFKDDLKIKEALKKFEKRLK